MIVLIHLFNIIIVDFILFEKQQQKTKTKQVNT